MPKPKTSRNPKKLDSVEHHCSQCNRPKLHEVYEHEDGVQMKCPCGHEFVDVIIKSKTEETRIDNDGIDES